MEDQENLLRYYESIKIHNIELNEIKRKITMLMDFPLFKDGVVQFYAPKDAQYAGFSIFRRLTDANSWISKATDLFSSIRYSVLNSLSQLDRCEQVFTPFRVTEEYKPVFYFVENALFRLFIAWDVLGHMYNHFYEIGVEIEKVDYNKIFKKSNCDFMDKNLNKVIGNKEVVEFVKKEYGLINEHITTNYEYVDGLTKGHHKYLKSMRNMAIHREDPHNFSIINSSNRWMPLVDAPQYELMVIVEDAMKLYQYISTIIKLYYFELRGYGLDVGELHVIKFNDH
ncbi:hypothetical protein [Paenibacillus elgii]|uniref:hypothetical protein n=1 Tax=Paenibacillus elgii TaxID=189691 RepID=UPI000FDAA478|nr:hypothetical protein [Paenibacillus elgii]NEN80796.1 hypothetical protein [Paenibacillus elgii]